MLKILYILVIYLVDYEKYEYSIEGNSLNLNLDGYWMTFEKGSASDNTDALDSRKDSGMYFEVEISGGTVKTALLSAQ